MGQTIWVDVQGRADDELLQDNSIMLKLTSSLDGLSSKLGVANLSDFHDYSDIAAEFADEFPLDDINQPSWFDPGQALAGVQAIRNHLAQHPEDLGFTPTPARSKWPSRLMEELEHCQAVLEDAVARGKKFRFLIVS